MEDLSLMIGFYISLMLGDVDSAKVYKDKILYSSFGATKLHLT